MRLANDNPMTRTVSMTLVFEAIVFVLAVPGMIQVADVPVGTALAVGGAAVLLALAATALLRRPVGWVLMWLTQVAGVALGLLTPWMYAVGGGFAALMVVIVILGRRIEAHRSR